MIARFFILLPYSLTIPEEEKFTIYSYLDGGYEIRVYPPLKRELTAGLDDSKEIKLDGKPAFKANILRIDFIKDEFDRNENILCDPPLDFIQSTLNYFLAKLRFVTQGSKIKPLEILFTTWKVKYINDNGTELQKEKGLVRERFSKKLKISYIAINKEIWEDIHKLPPYYNPPQWDSILLDAKELSAEVGPAIVLTMTALEVFITRILDVLARKSTIPEELWIWLNKREWLKQPSIKEQFDNILQILLGISLKQNNKLWEAFNNLQRARNSFVHEGVAKIGGKTLTQKDTLRYIGAAKDIIKFIREKLPDEMNWPEFKYKIDFQASLKLFGG